MAVTPTAHRCPAVHHLYTAAPLLQAGAALPPGRLPARVGYAGVQPLYDGGQRVGVRGEGAHRLVRVGGGDGSVLRAELRLPETRGHAQKWSAV